MHRAALACLFALIVPVSILEAQPLVKSAIQVDPGNTKQAGQTFAYRLTYDCSSTSGPCLNAEVVDLLPPEVQSVSTVPASPTVDVAAINVTPNFGGSGRTRVQFVMISPLPAGNSGDLLINVRFPNGSTPDGTVATNTADGINLGTSPGTFTTPPVSVTAVATLQATLSKTLTTSPANLDMPESYRLRIANPSNAGTLNLTSIGPVTDTLPPGTVFNGATPAADCQPGCVGTTPATLVWTSPCGLPLTPGSNCDVQVNVTFPSATFPSGTNVTNSFTADAAALGESPANLGVGQVTHSVTTFVPSPNALFTKSMAGATPNPPTLDQTFSYDLAISNNGNVSLDNMVVIDTLPVEMQLLSVTTGNYSGLSDFAAGEGVRVSYEKNTALGVFTLWGSSPNTSTNTTLTAPPPGLGAGEYVTRIRWEYGQSQAGMAASTRPVITGRIVNPDNAGGPVAIGDSIQNCADFSAVYTAGPTNVNRNDCETFTLSGPFVQLNPAKENLSGGGPFNPGQTVSWRLRVRSAPQSSDPAALQDIVVADLLPAGLAFSSWTFDDQGTGLPAPQSFSQIPNYGGLGRTLLRWNWNAGSGNLGVNQQVWVLVSTTIQNGVVFGPLSNTVSMSANGAGLSQRCSGSSTLDASDLDGDSSTSDTLCTATGTLTVAPIAQLVATKRVRATCDATLTTNSAGVLAGGAIESSVDVTNAGTVPMSNFVLVDILPFTGDTNVRDTNPRGSQWTPLLATPVTSSAGGTIYYSTEGNPCRGEVGGPAVGCSPPNWTTTPPDPISLTRSFKLELGGATLDPLGVVTLSYTLTAPASMAAGTFAYNSLAYQAERSDGLGTLAAELQKVGVSLGACAGASLGDLVWSDMNADGAQNDGATGLNGVPVELLTPGGDGLPGGGDDGVVAVTITADGPGGDPGWYRFPGLPAGIYFVTIATPSGYTITTRDATGDAIDSDADPATSASHVVAIAANATDDSVDFGLVPPGFTPLDYGDAPDPSYPTLLAFAGARHHVLQSSNPTLGASADAENDATQGASATGDDTTGSDDEDGVTLPGTLIVGTSSAIGLSAGATGGVVSCWIDFNRNGSWGDVGEQVVTDLALAGSASTNEAFTVPAGASPGTTYARCRIASIGGLAVTGEAADGEVEDHATTIAAENPSIGIGMCFVSQTPDPAMPGRGDVTFDVRVENFGDVPLSSVAAQLPLATVFASPTTYSIVSVTSADFALDAGYDGDANPNLLGPGVSLALGASGTVRIVVRVTATLGPTQFTLSAIALGTSPSSTVVTDVSQDGCDPDPGNDGDPSNDNAPTTFALASSQPIPSMGLWGLLAMGMLLAFVAVRRF
ncbi:MAG: SdrD B-like domain-containing protein [Thermoanaerobaculia bacterium]|jgi:uncharacterized repeat protein (TIGR01451 family)